MAGPGLIAHILVSKFCDHLPLYRQENILKRCGIELSRATMCYWVKHCGELFTPLVRLMQDEINDYDIAYADETRCQVLKEPNRKATARSYMWLFGGGSPERFCWVYQYHPGRQGDIAKNFFNDFTGYCHVDGYAGYHELSDKHIKLVGCLAHARRKFFEVTQAAKKKKGLAHQFLKKIQALYRVEQDTKDNQLSDNDKQLYRQQHAKPLWDEIEEMLSCHEKKVPPKSPIGKAIAYMQNQWHKLIIYLDDPRLEIDNNRSERSIKPFVIGRKNWLFNDNVDGANAAANIYSLIETCKIHHIDPYAYLRYLLIHLPQATTLEQLENLLPYHADPQVITKDYLDDRVLLNNSGDGI